MNYDLVRHLPVARFYYKGNHSHPVRRTVLVINSDSKFIKGYEVREGTTVRIGNDLPVKTYKRSNIARTKQLRKDNPARTTQNKSTLVRKSLLDLITSGF